MKLASGENHLLINVTTFGTVVSIEFSRLMRFYFHLHNDLQTHDEQGQELADEVEARDLALLEARTMAAESVRKGHLILSHFVQVTSADGKEVFRVTFADAVSVRA